MLDSKFVEIAFDRFAKAVVKKARARLSRGGHKVSGTLYKSLDNYVINVGRGGSVELRMLTDTTPDYAIYQDKGVKGAANFKSHKMAEFTPFKYKDKKPPIAAMRAFAKAKGINASPYALQTSIYQKGIPQTLFFTKPFRSEFQNLPESILKAFGKDVERFLEST
jgi:hypothetical protein